MLKKYWSIGVGLILLFIVLGYWGCNSQSKERYWRGRFDESAATTKQLQAASDEEHKARLVSEAKMMTILTGVQAETKRLGTAIIVRDTVISGLQRNYDTLVANGAPCEEKLQNVLAQNQELKGEVGELKAQVISVSNERDLEHKMRLDLKTDYDKLFASVGGLTDSLADCSKTLGISERGKTLSTWEKWGERAAFAVALYFVMTKK